MRTFEFHWVLGPFAGFLVLAVLAGLAFLIWMIVDAIGRPAEDFSSPGAKTGWILGMVLGIFFGFGVVVALVYLFVVRMPAGNRVRTPHGAYEAMQNPASRPAPGAIPLPAPPPPPAGAPPAPAPGYCRNCGAKLAAGSRFCHSCGTPTT